MYPVELWIKDTTESNISASDLDEFLFRTINFTLSLMINATISIYIAQTYQITFSWSFISKLRVPKINTIHIIFC